MQESGAKRPDKLLQRDCTEENDRADTLSDACQVGITDGDVPVSQSKLTKSAEAPEASQEAPLMILDGSHVGVFMRVTMYTVSSPACPAGGAGRAFGVWARHNGCRTHMHIPGSYTYHVYPHPFNE